MLFESIIGVASYDEPSRETVPSEVKLNADVAGPLFSQCSSRAVGMYIGDSEFRHATASEIPEGFGIPFSAPRGGAVLLWYEKHPWKTYFEIVPPLAIGW